MANFFTFFHLAPSFGVTPFEFMENIYGLESFRQPTVKICWSYLLSDFSKRHISLPF